ncbi:MAG: DPP IV N-terminal domain-containing protein [Gemmatimonadaceae bacterium]|nr:DPP IV N-terminal domain-containing protein [Gemmatimonadaceae bacterium]
MRPLLRPLARSFVLIATPVALAAQVATAAPGRPYQFTIEDYARAERFLGATSAPLVSGQAGRPNWIGTAGRFWYRTANVGGTASFWLVDPARKSRVPAFDHPKLATALATATGSRVDGDRLPFAAFTFADDLKSITATVRGARWRCDLAAYTCADAGRSAAPVPNSSTSPDGTWIVQRRANNLYARRADGSGAEVVLTTDGIPDFGYATNNAGWTHGENPILTWSPDGKRLATFQHDGRGVREMTLVGTNVGAPKVETWKYPFPGDSVIFRISRVVIDLPGTAGAAPRLTRLQMGPDQHRSTVSDHIACGAAICDLQWYDDGSHVAFISSSRDHKQAWLRIASAATGEVRTVLHETSPTQLGDASHPEDLWRILPATNEFIWWSDRDDWTHLYLHDLTTGQLKNRITTGVGNVSEIVRIDEKTRQIWFMANGREPGRDPYFQHFYRIGFDGKGLALLTPEAANHTVTLSPDGRFFTDVYSTPDTPPVAVVRDGSGRVVQSLERADIRALVASGWRAPIPVTVKARDGRTDIHGLMYVPTQLDTTRKYPIINHIYPGPQSGSVGPRSFVPARGDNQALAELGFIVVELDGMGTPGRSKTFRDFYYGRMNDNTIPDQVAGMKELATRHRYIDIDNVGIWGHSGGGFATASAMFSAPDFFDVGIAESGNHDNRNYEDDWGERYQGLLVREGNGDNYADEANQTHAANLKGKLFLIHGMMDDNVPPTNTTLVADALMKAGKDFDMLMLPQARHGFGADSPYIMRRRWDYFVVNLQGNVPPKEYRIGQPRVIP